MPVSLLQFAQQSNVTTGGSNTTALPFVAGSSLKVVGAATLSNAALLYGPMTACNTATFTSNLTVLGSLNATTMNYAYSNVTVYQSEEIRSNLLVDGGATLCNGLLSIGASTFSNALTVAGTMLVTGSQSNTGNLCVASNLTVLGSLNATTMNYAYSNVTVYQSEEIRSNLLVDGSLTGTLSNCALGTSTGITGTGWSLHDSWGVAYSGTSTQCLSLSNNTSLVVGYPNNGSNYGTCNALVAGAVGIGTSTPQ